MPPSRRATLAAIGATAVALTAGCSSLDAGGGATETTADAAFVVRLSGPETDRVLFDGGDVATVGEVKTGGSAARLPLTLTDAATADVVETFETAGVDETPEEYAILQFHEGEAVGRFGVAPSLAEAVADGEWDGRLSLTFPDRERAGEVRSTLADGSG
ncbi:hypothetical protein [Haloarcula litorea]|uniref:hypothetical protein n=1 Tax=Haloarcula litorea TaxID=3032579 RepID=UPI0023E78F67|nr:hypothetical protein [Halomicroarcula sp. GDY20]